MGTVGRWARTLELTELFGEDAWRMLFTLPVGRIRLPALSYVWYYVNHGLHLRPGMLQIFVRGSLGAVMGW